MSLTARKFSPIDSPSLLTLSTSLAAVATSRTSLSPPYSVRTDENVSISPRRLGAISLTWARTSPRLSANSVAPSARVFRSPLRSPIWAEPAASRSPTMPAWKVARNSAGTSPSGRVTPLTSAMSGSCAIRDAICSRSARACGLRRSRGLCTRMYCGIDWLTGKCRSSAAYPTELGADGDTALRSS